MQLIWFYYSFFRNITNDGKMSRRQLAAAYRGWYGVEAQYHALMHMSDDNMMKTKYKNQHISQKHDQDMKQMLEHEKYVKGESTKAIKALRDDFTSMLAYQYVYKAHNLRNRDKSAKERTNSQIKRPMSDKYDLYERERRSAVSRGPRPLGSLREIEAYKEELKVKFPPIENRDNDKVDKEKERVNMLGGKQYEPPPSSPSRNSNDKGHATVFPNIEHAMGVEIKYHYKTTIDTDKDSLYSAPAGMAHETESEITLDTRPHINAFDMGQNLLLMRRKEQEQFEKRRVLPPKPGVQEKNDVKRERDAKRRKLPAVPPLSTNIYPSGTKNSIGMKKLIRREATEIIESWSKDPKRLEIYEKARGLEKPQADHLRPKTTSEMFRDLKQYREQQARLNEVNGDNQSIIVRQLSPAPRPLSPVSTRRTEYSSRILSPLPARKREGSEKIPSVSRTSSYKELPDGPIEIHENALLTAAERIEKERLQREKQNLTKKLKVTNIKDAQGNTNYGKRQLPLPDANKKRSLPQINKNADAIIDEKHKEGHLSSNALLKQNIDLETIEKVTKANSEVAHKGNKLKALKNRPLQALSTRHSQSSQSERQLWKMSDSVFPEKNGFEIERDAYTPVSRKTEPIKRRLTPIPGKVESEQDSHVSSFTGKPLLEKLAKKLQFSYDNFSRVPPDAKKRLELRARNKRKAQIENAMLEAERKEDIESVANTERPPTRVSFNEKVVVFQTI